MKITVEENPGPVRRYAHIRPARGWGVERCGSRCPGTPRTCTREKDHRGPHVAHRFLNRVVAVWDTGSGTSTSGAAESGRHGRSAAPTRRGQAAPARRKRPRGKPIGLRGRGSAGALEALRKLAARASSSVEEIALLVFFLAFVWFAIDWLLLIMR